MAGEDGTENFRIAIICDWSSLNILKLMSEANTHASQTTAFITQKEDTDRIGPHLKAQRQARYIQRTFSVVLLPKEFRICSAFWNRVASSWT